MPASGAADLLLFVAGEPGEARGLMQDVERSRIRRMTGSVVGDWLRGAPGDRSGAPESPLPSSENDAPWHLPPEQIQCVNLVRDLARKAHRSMTVIDVNRASGCEALVDRWVGTQGVVPVLVRPDGARLEGLHAFVPSRVRTFLRGP